MVVLIWPGDLMLKGLEKVGFEPAMTRDCTKLLSKKKHV